MGVIYLLEWTPCIHESLHTTLAAHQSKGAAFKHMMHYKYRHAQCIREDQLRFGGPKGDKPDRFEQFFIRSIELCE